MIRHQMFSMHAKCDTNVRLEFMQWIMIGSPTVEVEKNVGQVEDTG